MVSHDGVASPLLSAARRLVGALPLAVEAFDVPWDADADGVLAAARAALRKVDGGDGVLLMVDLYGATPARVAEKLSRLGTPCHRISGLSLPESSRRGIALVPDSRDIIGGLSAEEKQEGYCLPCIATPMSDIVIQRA